MSGGARVLSTAVLFALACTDTKNSETPGAKAGQGGQNESGSGGSSGSRASGGSAGKNATGGSGAAETGGSSGLGGSSGTSGGGGSGGVGASAGTGGIAGRDEAGAGGEGGSAQDPIIDWDVTGRISPDENDFDIQGRWFVENDCMDAIPAGLPCTFPDPSLVGPDNASGWTTSTVAVCFKGVASKVDTDPSTGAPAYALQWGARLGFELNAGPSGEREPYDATAHGIRGFEFDISSVGGAPPTVRVNFVTPTVGEDAHFVEVTLPVLNQRVMFSDALQGDWVVTRSPLDTSALLAVTFHVYTNTTASKPFDICVSDVRVIL